MASNDELDEALRGVVAEIMRAAPGERAGMLNALFGLRLAEETVLSAPNARALAQSVEEAWFGGGATAEELAERIAALADE